MALSAPGWWALLLTLATVVAWTTRVIPPALASLLIMTGVWATGLVPDLTEAMAGFASPLIFTAIALSLLAQLMGRLQVGRELAVSLVTAHSLRPRRLLLAIALISAALPALYPRAVHRVIFWAAVLQTAAQRRAPASGALGRAMAVAGSLSNTAGLLLLTGGIMPLYANQLLAETGRSLTWLLWLKLMALPVLAILLVTTLLYAWIAGRASPEPPAPVQADGGLPGEGAAAAPGLALTVMAITTALWASVAGRQELLVLAALPAVALLASPSVRLLRSGDLADSDWNTIISLSTAFTLAHAMQVHGTTAWLAAVISRLIPSAWPLSLTAAALFALFLALRYSFANGLTCLTFCIPLAVQTALQTGLRPAGMALGVTLLMGTVGMMPGHSRSTRVAFGYGLHTAQAQRLMGAILSAVTAAVGLAAYTWLWTGIEP